MSKVGLALGAVALVVSGLAFWRTMQPISASVPGGEIKAFLQNNPDAVPGEAIRGYLMQNPEVVIAAVQKFEQQQQVQKEAEKAKALSENTDEIYDDGYSMVLGNPEGDITLVEFSDYNCGYCKRAHGEVQKFVEADGNIRLVIKEFPILGEGSVIAAQAALASIMQDDGKMYAAFSEALITHKGRHTRETVMATAEKVGLDVEKLGKDKGSDSVKEQINRTYALAKKLDINGTPAFILGDELIPGFVPAAKLEELAKRVREAG